MDSFPGDVDPVTCPLDNEPFDTVINPSRKGIRSNVTNAARGMAEKSREVTMGTAKFAKSAVKSVKNRMVESTSNVRGNRNDDGPSDFPIQYSADDLASSSGFPSESYVSISKAHNPSNEHPPVSIVGTPNKTFSKEGGLRRRARSPTFGGFKQSLISSVSPVNRKKKKGGPKKKSSFRNASFQEIEEYLNSRPVPLDDNVVLWIIVLSIALIQTLESYAIIFSGQFPFSMVLSWMLIAFVAGTEINGPVLVEEIKATLLDIPPPAASKNSSLWYRRTTTAERAIYNTQSIDFDQNVDTETSNMIKSSGVRQRLLRLFENRPVAVFVSRRIFRNTILTATRGSEDKEQATGEDPSVLERTRRIPQPRTSLRSSKSYQEQAHLNMRFHVGLARQLARFAPKSRRKLMLVPNEHDGQSNSEEISALLADSVDTRSSHSLGGVNPDYTQATILLSKMDIEPVARLRGLDVFRADYADPEMGTHPFLLNNGIRKVPTFLMNWVTQWGNILIYFELPDWILDCSGNYVEESTDPDHVRALKRFLKGDDQYRKDRLKILPEFVDAPYPIRLMTPKNKEVNVWQPGLAENHYHDHNANGPNELLIEVTVDLMGNSSIRGMAALFKRYLKSISVDFALVISKPENQIEEEPEAVIGLFRLDHVDVNQYPELPDRLDTDGAGNEEKIDAIRADLLVQEATRCISLTPMS